MSDDLIRRSNVMLCIECARTPTAYGEKVRCKIFDGVIKIPSADRPKGEWIDKGRNLWRCSNCGMEIYSESERDRNEFHKWCSRCGARMKGVTNDN